MVLTMVICTVHQVTTGSIVIACDNITSICIFQPDFVPDPNEESFDLVSCLHSLVQQSPVTLKPEHVTGHQKGEKQPSTLTRLELLNEEMDNSAKAYWNRLLKTGHSMIPPMIQVAHEGWSLWHQGQKLSCAQTDTVYPILEDHHTLHCWSTDHTLHFCRFPPSEITNVDWEACRECMSSLNLSACRTLPKHASENCGVAVTLQAWKKQSHNRCPHCDQPETAQHVLVCRAEAADETWKLNVTALENYMQNEDTDPFLQAAILRRLDSFRFPNRERDQLLLTPEVHAAVLA